MCSRPVHVHTVEARWEVGFCLAFHYESQGLVAWLSGRAFVHSAAELELLRFKMCLFLFYVCMFCLMYVCVYAVCMPHAHSGQKRASNPLELTSWMAVSHHVGAKD